MESNLATEKETYVTSKKERFQYSLYMVGQNFFFVFGTVILTNYCTDIGISTLALAGVMILVKIWDAINDTIFGVLVDKFHFKGGKFIPWLKISLFAIPLTTMLMFLIPHNFPVWGQLIWFAVAYILWDTSYTICDIPIYGLPTVMTSNQNERTAIMSSARLGASVGYNVAYMFLPMLIGVLRDSFSFEFSYEIVVGLFCIISFITMIPICFSTKERVSSKAETPIKFKDMVKYVAKNKYLLLYYLSYIVMGLFGVGSVLAIHVGRYLTPLMDNYLTITGIISLVPFIVLAFFLPKLVKKFDKFNLYFYCLMATAVLTLISYFFGYKNQTLFWILYLIRTLPAILTGILCFMFTADCAEYGFYKTGDNASGCAFAIQTFSAKIVGTLAGGIALILLSAIGFVEGAPVDGVPVTQPEGFAQLLWSINIFVPLIGVILGIIPLFFYKLRDYKVQIMAAANKGLISKEEGNELMKLSRKDFIEQHEQRIIALLKETPSTEL
jgi:Na+/melibiose symporter-like transporter